MKKIILLASLTLSACGVISEKVVQDSTLQNKTAFAYGVDAADVKIIRRSGGVTDVKWTADVSGETVTCYMTSAVVISSDAICSKGKQLKRSCNALLAAAGKCEK